MKPWFLTPELAKANLFLKAFGLVKIPILFYIQPTIVEASDVRTVIRINCTKRVKNHLGSMYFAVLMAGADLAGGYAAVDWIRRRKARVNIIFKDAKAEFLKRAEKDVLFTFADVAAVREYIDQVIGGGERLEKSLEIVATVPDAFGDEPVAKFTLTMSAKRKD